MTDNMVMTEVGKMLFGIRRSIRYHHRMAGFYNAMHRVAMFFTLFVAMSAGFWALKSESGLVLTLSILVAAVAALDATLNSSGNHRLHMLLAYRFQQLEKKFDAKGNLSDDEFEKVRYERLSIEQDEPEPKRLLDVICHYELLISAGHHIDRIPAIPLYRRLLAPVLSQTDFAQSRRETQ